MIKLWDNLRVQFKILSSDEISHALTRCAFVHSWSYWHVFDSQRISSKVPLLSFSWACNPDVTLHQLNHRRNLKYICACVFVCSSCVLMALQQAWSRQSFPATNWLSCFPYNMNNQTSGVHAVWLRLIQCDCWWTSALAWHWVSSHECSDLFHRRRNFQGWGQTPRQMAEEQWGRWDDRDQQGESCGGAGVWRWRDT